MDEEQATERTEDAGGGPLTPPTQSLHHPEVSLVHLAGTAARPSPWGRERGAPPPAPSSGSGWQAGDVPGAVKAVGLM